MSKLTPAALKDVLARDLPGALAPPQTERIANSHATVASHKKPVFNLLETEDAVVLPTYMPEIARYLRDTLGYGLLTNITAVDHLREDVIEIVYHFVHLDGGVLAIKARVPRDEPKLPTLSHEWPGADFQEREAYDLFGVVFSGHPNLTRIYMWDEFEGFPMRKDFPKQGDKYFASGE